MTVTQKLGKGLFFLLLLPAAIGLGGWQGWQWWSWASAPAARAASTEEATVRVEIPQGTSAQQIGAQLESAGLIRSASAWELWTRWQGWQNREGGFQAGTYELSAADPMSAIADKVWRGDVVQASYTIPEGWTLKQIAEYFQQQGFFTAEEFLKATEQVPRDRHPWLPANLPKLEGFLFPDTYQLPEGNVTPEAVVNQMLNRFQQVALPVYESGRGQTPYSLLEWVTLASIVEKEAVVQAERPTIAAVFARRLREGMPLGADPTVEYGLGIRQTVEQPLTYAQVQTPTPYNTYINPGLPPTPIAAPGLASLKESLAPGNTEYLYFMARYDGTHIFSRTLAEHEAAKVAVDQQLQQNSAGTNN